MHTTILDEAGVWKRKRRTLVKGKMWEIIMMLLLYIRILNRDIEYKIFK